MFKTIFKYQLKSVGIQKITLPHDYEILCVQVQNEAPCLWALINTESAGNEVYIEIIATGEKIDYATESDRKYISTFQLNGGALVFHVFEFTGILQS